MKGLIDKGHAVKFVSLYSRLIEEYSALQPTVIGFTRFFEIIDKLINSKGEFQFRNAYGLPSIFKLLKIIGSFDPDIVIVRSPKYISSWIVILLSKALKKKSLFIRRVQSSGKTLEGW